MVAAFWKLSKHYLLYSELNHIFNIPVSSAARHLLCIQYIHMSISTCMFTVLLLLALLLMTSCVCVETNHTRGDQKHGACLICHSVGSKRQLCTKPKNTKHSRTIIFSPKSIVHIYVAYSDVLTYGYVFKIRMVIWVEKQPSRGSSNFHDLGFPSTFIAALARSHAAKQRFTSSDCEFLKLMRFSSRNLRDFVPSC